ncbi:hypothetical protein ILYODFUR_035706 [Ilyodon furcidens]|uniref:Secreted protein n=1 Tax=Ilyodon furcidens TaxID=33524 RepID=A0ABV0V0U4_9TELE
MLGSWLFCTRQRFCSAVRWRLQTVGAWEFSCIVFTCCYHLLTTRCHQDPLVWRVTGVPHFHHLEEYKKVELSALQCLSVHLCGILKSWFHALVTFSSGLMSSVLDPA